MKKVLTIAVFGGNLNSNSMFETAELISATNPLLKKCKSRYTVFLQNGFSYHDLRLLLYKAEKATADIVTFEGGCLFKTSAVKYPDEKTDIFTTQLSCALNCKSIEKTELAPFKLAKDEIDCNEGAFEKLTCVLNEYRTSKTKVPLDVYSYARDIICDRLILFYKSYMLAVKKGADNNLLVEFDKQIKSSDMVLYKVFENRFGHAKLEKLRAKNFKISFITATTYKMQLK